MRASIIASVRAEALFVSDLQPSEHPTPKQVRAAVLGSVDRHRAAGCAAMVAQEYGEHPVEAVARMRWATAAVHDAYPAVGRWTVWPRTRTLPAPLSRRRPAPEAR
ncbi:hypothetical protein [Micromonospora sp. NPDC093277]|uniref:hypothetical protein n=1 Tax=Micromonospora sp. NPDC093277 TaxID=3364291 RepID=UPI00380F2824